MAAGRAIDLTPGEGLRVAGRRKAIKQRTVLKEKRMIDQDCSQAPGASLLMAEDTAVQLFQIAALMLGDEQEAVSLVEETVAKVERDPCTEATVAYAEARSLLVHTAMQRMAGLYPEAFAVPIPEPPAA